jgi:hypothetical protein
VSGRFDGHDPHRGTDTAGVPWAGRTLSGTGFEHDTGEADQALAEALRHPEDEEALVAATATARLLTPVVAVPGETEEVAGLAADATSEMATVTLTAPDGTRALPVFSSTASLAAWDPRARPVPVTAQRAALAAVQEGCQVMVLDLPGPGAAEDAAGHPPYTFRPSMVWALAMARPWVPAHRDEQVARAVAAAVREEASVAGHRLGAGAGGALQVELELRPGLGPEEVRELVTRVGERLATDGEVRARIDALAFSLGRR